MREGRRKLNVIIAGGPSVTVLNEEIVAPRGTGEPLGPEGGADVVINVTG